MLFSFEDYVLDTDRRELRSGPDLVPVEPQVFDLLAYMLRHRDRVLSKDDLLAAVWHGRIVSESTLSSRINAARKAVGDDGEQQRLIRTIARKGIRFVGEVREGPIPSPSIPTRAASEQVLEQQVSFCRTDDGLNLAVASVGDGPPLIKTANWLTHVEYDWDSPIWSKLLHRLAGRRRLVRYNGRGTGLSDRNAVDISFPAFVRDLESVSNALALERCALLGISQGAAVAIAYAAKYPDRISKLILYGGYVQGRNKRGSATEIEMAQAYLSIMRHGWGDPHSAFMRAFSAVYIPNGSSEQIKWFADMQRHTASAETAVRIRQACDDIDVVDLLSSVRAPTLVLHSRHDNVAPFDQGRLIAASIRNARLVSLESDNHFVLPDEPVWPKVVQEIENFLAE